MCVVPPSLVDKLNTKYPGYNLKSKFVVEVRQEFKNRMYVRVCGIIGKDNQPETLIIEVSPEWLHAMDFT